MTINKLDIDLSIVRQGLVLSIVPKRENTLFISDDYIENNEAEYQLIEGTSYDYKFSKKEYYFKHDSIIKPHKLEKHLGIIEPNFYVGTLFAEIFNIQDEEKSVGKVSFEIQSCKSSYREDYRNMLQYIAEKSIDLILQTESPVMQTLEIDYSKDEKESSLFQKFSFVKSIIEGEDFTESVYRIMNSPVTCWKSEQTSDDVRKIKRINYGHVKEIVKNSNRVNIPNNHYLNAYGLTSMPQRIVNNIKSDSVDTPENQFVKHVLETYYTFGSEINSKSNANSRLNRESRKLTSNIESLLQNSFFREVSQLKKMIISSPVLQRKEGYREVLKSWLMFDIIAKLSWAGGEDVYHANKKNVAILYEYWVFFKLLDLFCEKFEIDNDDLGELFKSNETGLDLVIKHENDMVLKGVYRSKDRDLNFEFSYNKNFDVTEKYPNAGSWSVKLRPDYTISFWPQEMDKVTAELQELIVHIHFDSKYKIENIMDIFTDKNNDENISLKYKQADIYKMHTYKDAIRRSAGAYIIYPGDTELNKRGFHEILPGLGAFSLKPSEIDDGFSSLNKFIDEVIEHMNNRVSQRENLSYYTYFVNENQPQKLKSYGKIPLINERSNTRFPPLNEILVIAGYVKNNKKQLELIEDSFYHIPYEIALSNILRKVVYLLLYTNVKGSGDCKVLGKGLYKITSSPKVVTKKELHKLGYTQTNHEKYYLIKFNKEVEDWSVGRVKIDNKVNSSYAPSILTLAELMETIC